MCSENVRQRIDLFWGLACEAGHLILFKRPRPFHYEPAQCACAGGFGNSCLLCTGRHGSPGTCRTSRIPRGYGRMALLLRMRAYMGGFVCAPGPITKFSCWRVCRGGAGRACVTGGIAGEAKRRQESCSARGPRGHGRAIRTSAEHCAFVSLLVSFGTLKTPPPRARHAHGPPGAAGWLNSANLSSAP